MYMAGSSIAIRDSWFVRLLQRAGLVGIDADGTVHHSAGADWAANSPSTPTYDPKTSLSAMAAFPWVYASVTALSTDLSKVPIKAYHGDGANAEVLDSHPLIELLERPSTKVPGVLMRRQLVTDLVLSGDAFLLIAGTTEPAALIRMHPSRVRIIPESDGQIGHYEYAAGQSPEILSVDQVMHVRSASWNDDPSSLWGVGAIQCLHNDLKTEKSTSDLTASTAKTGRPTGILSPSEDGDRWSKDQIKVLREAYERQLTQESGVLIVGGQVEYEPISLTPRDMEFSSVRNFTREAVLAALDVPPTRVGLPSANYATSKEQARRYWEGLSGRAAMIDSELTRVARMFPNSDNITIKHDFSEVDALQESRSERVGRVVDWTTLGVGVADAAAYEGFDDLPFQVGEEDEGQTEDGPDATATSTEGTGDDPLASTALNGAQIASLLNIVAAVGAGAISFDAAMTLVLVAFPTISEEQARNILLGAGEVSEESADGAPEPPLPEPDQEELPVEEEPPAMEEEEDEESKQYRGLSVLLGGDVMDKEASYAVWRSFVDEQQAPLERALQHTMRRYLKGYAARISSKLPKMMPKKAVGAEFVAKATTDAWIVELLDSVAERQILTDTITPVVESSLEDVFSAAMRDMPVGFDTSGVDRDWLLYTTRTQIGELITNIEPETRRVVQEQIARGIEEGASINSIQGSIMSSRAFSAGRALRIARTEATKSVNMAGIQAWEQSVPEGQSVEFVWLTAGDEHVRDSHKRLNGKVRGKDGKWRIGIDSASYPGGFSSAANTVNCRCTYLPRIK